MRIFAKVYITLAIVIVVVGSAAAIILSLNHTPGEALPQTGANGPAATSTSERTATTTPPTTAAKKAWRSLAPSYPDTGTLVQHNDSSPSSIDQLHKLFTISPNGKYTIKADSYENGEVTWIVDSSGKQITKKHEGDFEGWTPDGSKIMLFEPGGQSIAGRHMYYLTLDDKFYDSGLPDGTIDAAVSPSDGTVLYTLADKRSDKSKLYARTPDGTDVLLLDGEDATLCWQRYSPDGKYVAFMRYIITGGKEDQSIWVMKQDGSGLEAISDVDWNYPPQWSTDSSHFTFTTGGIIWDYYPKQTIADRWATFGSKDAGVSFQYPLIPGTYTYRYGEHAITDDPSGTQLEWNVKERGEMPHTYTFGEAVSQDYGRGREGLPTESVKWVKEGDKYFVERPQGGRYEVVPLRVVTRRDGLQAIVLDSASYWKNILPENDREVYRNTADRIAILNYPVAKSGNLKSISFYFFEGFTADSIIDRVVNSTVFGKS